MDDLHAFRQRWPQVQNLASARGESVGSNVDHTDPQDVMLQAPIVHQKELHAALSDAVRHLLVRLSLKGRDLTFSWLLVRCCTIKHVR